MVFVPPKDRVLEHSTSNSQTVFAVTGAVDASMNAFSASMSVGDTTIGGVVEPGIAFRSGKLTYSATNQITIDSTGFESKGTFSSGGTKEVFMGLPAKSSITVDGPQSLATAQQGRALANIGAAQFSLINGKIVESHTGGVVTYAIKTLAGGDPSGSDPVAIIFGDGTQVVLAAALSVSSSNSSGTFGSVNSTSFRLWFCIINDGGTLRLGLRNCVDPASGSIYGFPGSGIGDSVGGNNTLGGTWTGGPVVTSKPFVIIGYADYDGGLATAGSYISAPSRVVMVGPSHKKPGDIVQTVHAPVNTAFSTTSTSFVSTTVSGTITPTSRQNPVRWQSVVNAGNAGGNTNGLASTLNWSGVGDFGPTHYSYNAAAGSGTDTYSVDVKDWFKLFDTISAITLAVRIKGDSASFSNRYPQSGVGVSPFATVQLTEYMG
jgi:hypothetical protein